MLPPDHSAIEETIAERLLASDRAAAVTAAIKGYGPQILGYLAAVLRDEEAANEVFSSFAEDIWVGIDGFRRECSFRTWAYKLAWHAAMRFARDPYRRKKRRLETSAISGIVQEVRSTTAVHMKDEVKDRLARVRESLAPEEQTLLVLRLDRRLSWEEIALVMSTADAPVGEAALRQRFTRLKDKLKKALA